MRWFVAVLVTLASTIALTGPVPARAAEPGVISGTISVPDGPGSAYFVHAYTLTQGVWTLETYDHVADDGTFRVGVPEGTHRLYIGASPGLSDMWWGDTTATTVAEADDIAVQAGEETTGIDATLVPSSTVTGRLLAPDGGPGDVSVRIIPDTGPEPIDFHGDVSATDQDPTSGTFTIPDVSVGRYWVVTNSQSIHDVLGHHPPIATSYNGAFSKEETSSIVVAPSSTTVVPDVQLTTESTVDGQVQDPYGRGLGYTVIVPYRRAPSGAWTAFPSGTVTRSDGTFHLPRLGPGTYRLQVRPGTQIGRPSTTYPISWWGGASLGTARDLVLGTGVTRTDVDPVLPFVRSHQVRMPTKPRLVGRLRVDHRVRLTAGTWLPRAPHLRVRWHVGDWTHTGRSLRLRPWMAGERLRAEVRASAPGLRPRLVVVRAPRPIR